MIYGVRERGRESTRMTERERETARKSEIARQKKREYKTKGEQ